MFKILGHLPQILINSLVDPYVHCRFGGVEAATFCALWSLYDQLQYDKGVNVYQLTKLYHLKRPGIIGSKVR